MDAIFQRRSIRRYEPVPVSPRQMEQLLRAGMAAPTSGNNQEWEFVVIRSAEIMARIVELDSYAGALKSAPVCVALCADMRRVAEPEELFWVQDLSAAAQNMLVAAASLGLGGLWMGLYPGQRAALRSLLALPAEVEPLILLAFGVPAEKKSPINRYLPNRVHQETYRSDSQK